MDDRRLTFTGEAASRDFRFDGAILGPDFGTMAGVSHLLMIHSRWRI